MLDLLNFIFSSFWHFLGVSFLLSLFLYHGVRLLLGFFKYLTVVLRGWPHEDHEEEFDGENFKN